MILGASLGMLFIELTSRCNERCLHCYADSSPERNDFLTLATIKQVLEQGSKLGKPFIQFTGGDPLIHPDIVAATAYAHKLGLKHIEIFTNGLLLRPALLSELAVYTPRFCFSLYSHNASIHDAITCVPGSLDKTITAIRRVQAENLEVRIGIALMEKNADSLVDTMRFLQEELNIPPHFVRIDPINTTGRGANVQPAKHIHIQHTTTSHSNENQGNQNQRLGKLAVSADGNVHPCVFARDISLGNIHQHTLQEMLSSLSDNPKRNPSNTRWQACKKRLSCHDCRIIAYHLGA
jgi:radical SAM protein with 4Fe4S-binding SPASM domain